MSSLVSILIPSYKPEHFEIALTSALAQTYKDKEIIVSDDCKTDEIAKICQKYGGVIYSRNPNPGAANNFFRLVRMAQGEYIKFLLDDDILHPFCVQRLIEAFALGDDVRLAYGPRDWIDRYNKVVGSPRFVKASTLSKLDGAVVATTMLTHAVNIVGEFTSVMFRKRDVVDSNGDATFLSYKGHDIAGLTDVATWLNLCWAGSVGFCPETLSYFRKHGTSNSNPSVNPDFRATVTEWLLFVKIAIADGSLSRDQGLKALNRVRALFLTFAPIVSDLSPELAEIDELKRTLAPAEPAGNQAPVAAEGDLAVT